MSNKISLEARAKLGKFLQEVAAETNGDTVSYEQLRKGASERVGREITTSNIKSTLELFDIKLKIRTATNSPVSDLFKRMVSLEESQDDLRNRVFELEQTNFELAARVQRLESHPYLRGAEEAK